MNSEEHNLKQDVAEVEASLTDFKQIRRDKREKDEEEEKKRREHQANRWF